MADTVILLGAGPGPHAIRGNLVDLAALGLIDRVLWASAEPDAAATGDLEEITGGDGPPARRVRLSDALRGADGRVLLIALDEPDATGSTLDAAAVAAWTDAVDRVGTIAATRVHLVLPRLPLPEEQPTPMPGWAMLALSPEDSDSPRDAVVEQHRAAGAQALARYAAPAIAGLAGLWAGSTLTPLLDGPGGPVAAGEPGQVRLVRVHHRRIDTAVLEQQLRRRALDVRDRAPQPQLPGGARVIAGGDDEDLLNRSARSFADLARGQLVHRALPPARRTAARVGALEALRRFLAFFFRSVIGNPRSWYAAQVQVVQSTFARAVQGTLYGADSDVEVVCGAHSGTRRREDIDELTSASAALRERLDRNPEGPVGPPPVLSPLWRTYVNTGLSLVDGADREEGPLAAAKDHYGNPVVVSRPALAAGDVADSFDGAHPTLTALLGDSLGPTRIAPFDPYAARAYGEALDVAVRQTTDRSVAELRESFHRWRAEHAASFAWRVGERITGFLDESRGQAAEAEERLARIRAERAALGGDDLATGDRLVRTLRLLTVFWALLQLVVLYLMACEYRPSWRFADWLPTLPWNRALLAVVLSTVLLLAVGFAVFARAQRGVFERTAARRRLAEDEEIAVRNLVAAVAHVERAGLAYGQHQSWSAILARAVSAPFGRDAGAAGTVRIPESGMPRATVIAEAVIDEAELGRAVGALKDRLFPPNWAEEALLALLEAARTAAEQNGDRMPEVGQLYGQAGAGSSSPLDRLSRLAVDDALPRGGADRAWAPALAAFAASGAAGPLLSELRAWEDGTVRRASSAELRTGLDDPAGAAPPRFAPTSMTSLGVNRGGTEVDPGVSGVFRVPAPGEDSGTLAESVTVVHYGRAAEAGWIAARPPAAAEAADAAAARDRAAFAEPWPPVPPTPPGSPVPDAARGEEGPPAPSGPALPEFGDNLM